MGKLSIVVRQRVTHPRHKERFETFMTEQERSLRSAVGELEAVRRYRFEKEELFFYTWYDLRGDVASPRALDVAREVRAAWRPFGPDMRELTCGAFERIWHREAPSRTSAPADHPITIERLAFDPAAADQERAWNSWQNDEILPDQLGRLPLAAITRYRALSGDPRYYLNAHEYIDEQSMRDSIARAEKPGGNFGSASPSPFWAGWAKFMPYIDDLTRWIILPVRAAVPA